MFAGSGIFPSEMHPVGIPDAVVAANAFDQSKLGQQEYARQYRWQGVPAPAELGAVPAHDRFFASIHGAEPLEPGWNIPAPGRDPPAPIWADENMMKKKRQLEYEQNWQTHGSGVADMRISRTGFSHAPPQVANLSLVAIAMMEK